jgi:hypothetical protein
MRTGLGLVLSIVVLWPVGAAAAKTPLPGIRSPSRNITCFFVPGPPGHLLCDIRRAAYLRQVQDQCMATAGLDWHGFELSPSRPGSYVCSGGILYNSNTSEPRFATLAYGRSWTHGPFTCHSRVTGLTCSSRTGHGLFLSRETWRRW